MEFSPGKSKRVFYVAETGYNRFGRRRIVSLSRVEMGERVKRTFGEKTGKTVFARMAEEDRTAIKDGTLKIEPSSGNLSNRGIIPVPYTRHYGE